MGSTPNAAACLLLAEDTWGGTLHAIRSVARSGITVYVATAGRGASVYRRSRGCVGAQDFDAGEGRSFIQDVRDWVLAETTDEAVIVVIPLSDRLLAVLDEHRSVLNARFRIVAPHPDVTPILLDKSRSFAVAAAAGINMPKWMPIRSPDDEDLAGQLRLPVIVRPTSWDTIGNRYFKLEIARSYDDLRRVLQGALERGAEVVAQEYLEVEADAVEFAIVWRSADATKTAICTGRKRQQSAPEGGVMVWGETAVLPDVAEAARRFLDVSSFTGLGGLELIRHGGQLHFVEFNPRLEAIHFLATAAGVDTVAYAAMDALCPGTAYTAPSQTHAAAWIGSAALQRLSVDHRFLCRLPRERIEFARFDNRARAIWCWSDPLPGLMIGARLVRSASRRRLGPR